MKWLSYGPNAWLLQVADTVGDDAFFRVRSVVDELEQHPLPGLTEVVPALTSVLVEFDPRQADVESVLLSELAARLNSRTLARLSTAPVKTVPVRYNGPDLERVAELHALDVREVIHLHSSPVYTVYMIGFSPGFPYLGPLDSRLHAPRLASPRPRVSAGSVAIGGEHTGIYTVNTPGGWNIIGHTPMKLFDPDQEPEAMFLLKTGDRVKFVAID